MQLGLFELSVLAEFTSLSDANKWHRQLASNDLVDDHTMSLKWSGVNMRQVNRMRSLMQSLLDDGKLVSPATIKVAFWVPQEAERPVQRSVPFRDKVVNLTRAVGRSLKRVVKWQRVTVARSVADRRLDICKACSHYRDDTCVSLVMPDGSIEKGCGCNLSLKVRVASESCPVGKW